MRSQGHPSLRNQSDNRTNTTPKSGQRLLICDKDRESAPSLARLGKATLYITDALDRRQLSDVVSEVSPTAVLISRELLSSLLEEGSSVSESVEDLELALVDLRPRDAEVVRMLAKGLHNHEIAHSLGISVRLVKSILSALYMRHDVTNRTELLGQLMEEGHSTCCLDRSQSKRTEAVDGRPRSNAVRKAVLGKPA